MNSRNFLFFSGLIFTFNAMALAKFNFSADKYKTNLDDGITSASGNVKVWMGDKEVYSEELEYDPNTGAMNATGNVVYKEPSLEIRGTKVVANAQTGFGSYFNAIMLYGSQFSVEAKELNYYEKNKFRADYAKISSCVDCPQAWSVTGSLIDIEIEGFAKIHHAMVMIKDVPVAYFPVFYIPIKSQRQSGLLVPQLMYNSELGTGFLFPYFWAISSNADATLRYDYFTEAGSRAWSEFRYLKSNRSNVNFVGSYNKNKGIRPKSVDERYGVSLSQRAQLSEGWVQRLNSEFASDPRYSFQFEKDFQARRQPTLPTDLSVTWQNKNAYFESNIYISQDNIERNPNSEQQTFGTLHTLPYASLSYPSRNLGLNFYLDSKIENLSLRRENLNTANVSELDTDSDVPWIRAGDRVSLTTSLARPTVLGRATYLPELNLRLDQYRFLGDLSSRESVDYPKVSKTPARFRYHFKQELESTVSRVFDVDGSELNAMRHSFTPRYLWSYAPNDFRARHPFFDDLGAPRFDVFDPNSDAAQDGSSDVLAERFLKPHNLMFLGFRTQLMGRFGSEDRRYEEFLAIQALQSFNVQEDKLEDLSFVLSAYRYGFRVKSETSIEWETKTARYVNELGYDRGWLAGRFAQIITDVPEESGLSGFEEYQFSLTLRNLGSFELTGLYVYDGILNIDKEQNYRIHYKSDSKCWYFTMGFRRRPQIGTGNFEFSPYVGVIFSEDGANYLPF